MSGDSTATPAAPMRRSRIWIVYALFAVIVGGHLVEVATQREHWPFSPYQMWSKPSVGWDVKREMLRGVTDEPTPREVSITPQQLYPIPYQMVVVNMQQANRAVKEGNTKQADTIIRGLLEHYNNRRAAGKHDGPPLKELRLYQITWKMDTDASEASLQNPTETKLLFPVLTDEQRAAAVPPIATKITKEFGEDGSSD
jgi:hypothetical protein